MPWYKDEAARCYGLTTFPKLDLAKEYIAAANLKRKRECKPLLKIWSREITANEARYFITEEPGIF